MSTFDAPNVSVMDSTPEESISRLKAYLNDLSIDLNIEINQLKEYISNLEARVSELEGSKK